MQALKLEDLKPAESTFKLSTGVEVTLKKFSLREQIWIKERFVTQAKIKEVFETQSLVEMAEIAHNLIKDKSKFPTFLEFADHVVTHEDKINLIKALLATIGISQPVLEELTKKDEPQDPKA